MRFASTKQCRADIKRVARPALSCVTGAHAVAAVVKEQAGEQGAAFMAPSTPTGTIGLQETLNFFKDPARNDRLVLAGEPMPAVAGFAEIGAVFQEIGEGAIGERNSAGDLARSSGRFLVTMPLSLSSSISFWNDLRAR